MVIVRPFVYLRFSALQPSLRDGAIFLMIPGASCLATIVLSFRDENHSTIEAPRIKLALMGFTFAANVPSDG
jgi:hypothetical protein